MDKILIINKLKAYLNIKTDTKFADFLGVKQNTISSWKKRNTLDYELIISKCDTINANWLFTGEGSMFKPFYQHVESNANTVNENSSGYSGVLLPIGSVPFFNLPISVGHFIFDENETIHPNGYMNSIPGTENTDAFLPVVGFSMLPEILEGVLIGVRKIKNWNALNTQYKYLIITNEYRMIKYIEHDEEDSSILWCVSPNFKRFKVYKDDIVDIQCITFVLNPG